MTELHDHPPVILELDVYDRWLDPDTPQEDLKPLLSQNLDGELHFRRVGRQLNNARTKDAICIEPVNPL